MRKSIEKQHEVMKKSNVLWDSVAYFKCISIDESNIIYSNLGSLTFSPKIKNIRTNGQIWYLPERQHLATHCSQDTRIRLAYQKAERQCYIPYSVASGG